MTTVSPKDVEKTVSATDDLMKTVLKLISKHVVPFAFNLGTSSKASRLCKLDLLRTAMAAKRLNPWILKMMDSYGKLSGGVLEGITSSLGDYDECQNVIIGGKPKPYERTGAYCLLEIRPPGPILAAVKDTQINKENSNLTEGLKSVFESLRHVRTNPNHMMYRFGICVPSSCTAIDMQNLIDRGFQLANKTGQLPIHVSYCDYKYSFMFETDEIIIMGIMCVFLLIVILGTCVAYIRSYGNSIPSTLKLEENTENTLSPPKPGLGKRLVLILSKFSLSSNISRLFNCEKNDDASDVCKGLNLLTILFAIYLHTYALPHPLHLYRFRNTLNFTKFIDEILFGAIANSSVGIDSFFFLAGFHFVYTRWKLIKRPKILPYLLKFIVLILIRFTVAQLLVGCLLYILPGFGSGPLWRAFIEEPIENCKEHWWMNLLYIQNFLGPYDMCLYQTWFFATMVHLFLITTLLVYFIHRWPSWGILCHAMVIILGILAMAAVTGIAGHPATIAIYFYDYRTSINLWKYVYTQFYTHIGPHCVGMLTAFVLAEYPTRKLDRRLAILVWIASLLTMASIIFGLYSYRDGQKMSRSLAIFYAAVHRPVWAFCIGWIVYACATGYGGIVNTFLSWRAFIPLERLSYLAYLLHILVMYYHGGVQREKMYLGHYNQFMCYIAYTVTSFILAFICYIIFQAPYQVIEEFIFIKNGDSIWDVHASSVSQITLQSTITEKNIEEDSKSKVLISRY